MLKIKVCGMKDPDGIAAVSALHPDFMGFIFYPPSRRYIQPGDEKVREAILNIPEGIIKTGVFVNAEFSTIKQSVEKYCLNAVQLHADETPDFCEKVKGLKVKVIKSFSVAENFDFQQLEDYIWVSDYFLFDTFTPAYGGSGKQFNWEILNRYPFEQSFILSGGIGPEDAGKLRHLSFPWPDVIDINSRFEMSPGQKDVRKVSAFIEKIREHEVRSMRYEV